MKEFARREKLTKCGIEFAANIYIVTDYDGDKHLDVGDVQINGVSHWSMTLPPRVEAALIANADAMLRHEYSMRGYR